MRPALFLTQNQEIRTQNQEIRSTAIRVSSKEIKVIFLGIIPIQAMGVASQPTSVFFSHPDVNFLLPIFSN